MFAFLPPLLPVPEDHGVRLFVKGQFVVRQVVVFGDVLHQEPELLLRALGAAFLVEEGEGDLPFGLLAAVFTGDLVDTPLQRLPEPEIVPVEGQHGMIAYRVENPVRDRQLDPQQAPVEAVLAPHRTLVHQAEVGVLLLVTVGDVGADPGACQAVYGLAHGAVVASRGAPVGENQHVMGVDADAPVDLLALVQFRHDLGNGVDQDVLVVDRRQALVGGDDLQPVAVVLVAPDVHLGLFREGIEGVFHLRHDVLEYRIGHVADKQIALRMLVRQELIGGLQGLIRGIRNHGPVSWYQEPLSNIRGIRNLT